MEVCRAPISYDAGVVDLSTFAIKIKHSWIGKYAIVPWILWDLNVRFSEV